MKKLVILIAVIYSTIFSQQYIAPDYIPVDTGNDLYNLIRIENGDVKADKLDVICAKFYLNGYFTGWIYGQGYVKDLMDIMKELNGHPNLGENIDLIIKETIPITPEGSLVGQTHDIIYKFLKENPQNRHNPHYQLVQEALMRAWGKGEIFYSLPDLRE